MKISTIKTGFFKLDGGAMFGVVPKMIWNKINPADERNLCTWAMRSMLIEYDDKKILIDTGLGDKQSEKFFSHYDPHGDDSLKKSLQARGCTPEDITDVLLTHLHFDHVGGAIDKTDSGELVLAFPNATYWSCERHWKAAMNPNAREKASFLKENFAPIQELGALKFVDEEFPDRHFEKLSFIFCDGHTEAMMLPVIHDSDRTIVYCADLLPSAGHLHVPFVMAYDTQPLISLQEKGDFAKEAVENNYVLFFEHDPKIEAATVKFNDRGKCVVDEVLSFS